MEANLSLFKCSIHRNLMEISTAVYIASPLGLIGKPNRFADAIQPFSICD